MKLVSGILGLTLSSVVALASANAADMYHGPVAGYKDGPVYAEVNWSGLYAGVNAGYGWNGASLDAGAPDPAGAFGGGQIGYNFQRGNIVFGLETDFQGAGISDSNLAFGKSEMDWFGTVRARLGFTFANALVYGTGGFAYGHVNNTGFPSETQTGWVAGGGVEYKLAPNWSAKAEYQFLNLDATNVNGAGRLGDADLGQTEAHTVRVGLNYFFNNAYAPLK
jgi:outer membrane immunogenic protein